MQMSEQVSVQMNECANKCANERVCKSASERSSECVSVCVSEQVSKCKSTTSSVCVITVTIISPKSHQSSDLINLMTLLYELLYAHQQNTSKLSANDKCTHPPPKLSGHGKRYRINTNKHIYCLRPAHLHTCGEPNTATEI